VYAIKKVALYMCATGKFVCTFVPLTSTLLSSMPFAEKSLTNLCRA
jgi:hypothetical protein